jgi:hypothetical protein
VLQLNEERAKVKQVEAEKTAIVKDLRSAEHRWVA